MGNSNIKTNFIYNISLTLSTYIINLLLFPYVSRILGVENLGKIGFVENVIGYFSLFSIMGIGTVGIREIAACGTDRVKRSQVFSSIFSLLLIFTSVCTAVYIIAFLTLPQFQQNKELFIAGTGTLFFTSMLIEWFYQGTENFKFITVRMVLVKLFYAVLVFILVKEKQDYQLYFYLTVLVVILNATINLCYARKYVDFSFKNILLKKYLKPIFSLGVYKLMISMYTTFNVVYLGFTCSENQVGYYYTSTKIFYILLGVLSAFTSVMLPRMSSLIAEKKIEEFKHKIDNSFDLVFSVAIPVVIFFTILAPETIHVISGKGYEGAIPPMRIIMPIMLLSGLAQIWVIQVLLPLKRDRIVLYSSIVGAVVGITANILIVGIFGAIGSALVLLFSEISSSSISFYYVIRKRLIHFPLKKFSYFTLGSIPYVFICLFIQNNLRSSISTLVITAFFCLVYFVILNRYILKKTFISTYLAKYLH